MDKVGSTAIQLLLPSTPRESTHGVQPMLGHGYTPTDPVQLPPVHDAQLPDAVLPSAEYGLAAGHTTQVPLGPYVPAGHGVAEGRDDPAGQ